jgi:MFS family permease
VSFERSPIGPLRHRRFRLLWLGACASLLGDGIYLVALAWQAYSLTERPAGLALLGVCATVPQLMALVAGGVISDRFDRRQVLLLADVARAVAVGAVAVQVLGGNVQMWHLAVLSIVYGAGAGFAAPAFDAILPSLVPDRELEQANALEQFLRPAMLRLAGPAVGGVIIAAGGAGLAFLIDAATFVISAVCLLLMGSDVRREGDGAVDADDAGSLLDDAVAGIRFVRQRVWLWGTFAAATVSYLMFIGPTEVLLPYLVRVDLHGSATDLGLILGSGGIGALAAAALVGMTGLPRRQLTFMYVTWALATLSIAGYGIAQSRWHLVAACFAFNALEAAGTIAWAITKQRLVPPDMLGRVSSLDWFISIAGLPLSFALTAPAAHLFGARETMIGAGVLGATVTIAALFLPGMRDVDGAATAIDRTPEAVRPA